MARTYVQGLAATEEATAGLGVRTKERAMMVLRPAAMMEKPERKAATFKSERCEAGSRYSTRG